MKLDSDFLKIQIYANKLFDSLPIIKQENIKSDKELINQLQFSCVCYGRKLVSLFDKYQILQKRAQENQTQLLVNLAATLNVQPNESAVLDSIHKVFKSNEQLLQKIEYLNHQSQSKQQPVYQKMLTHEQQLTEELQLVVDKLVKELKQSKDDKQILLDELKSREEQIHSLMSPMKRNNNNNNNNNYSNSNNSSTKKLSNSDSRAKVRFQQQLYNSFQNLQHQIKCFLQEIIEPSDFQLDGELLGADDVQILSLNISNLNREIYQLLQQKEDAVKEFIQNLEMQFEKQLQQEVILRNEQIEEVEQAENKIKELNQMQRDFKALQGNYDKLQHSIKQMREIRGSEIERAIHSELPVFVVPDNLMDSELQMRIEKHNQQLQMQKEMTFGAKKKQEKQYLILKIGTEEGLSRMQVILQELARMADSVEAQKLLRFCKEELQNILNCCSGEEENVEAEIRQQRQTWLSQIEVLRKYFQEQIERLLEELEKSQEQQRESNESLIQENEGLVRKVKQCQQELSQLKDISSQQSNQLGDQEKLMRKQEEEIRYLQELERKQGQTLDVSEQEQIKQKQIFQSQKKQIQLENEEIINKLNDKIQIIEFENKTYKKQLQEIEDDLSKLKQQRQQTEQNWEGEKQSLRKHLEEKKKQIHNLDKENKKLNQSNIDLQEELQQLHNQVCNKDQELHELNQTLYELEDFSRKQIEVIRQYEDKVAEINQIKKSLEFNNQDNDQIIQQLQQKNQQLLQVNNQLKHENEKLLNDLSLLQKNAQKQTEQLIEDSKDKSNKQQEINKILKEETRNLKAQLELKIHQLRQVEQELNDKNQELDKAQKICKQLNLQLSEFRSKVDYFEHAQLDTQNSHDSYQKKLNQLLQENQSLKREIDKQTHQRNKSNPDPLLMSEISNLKTELRKMETLLSQERQGFELELNHYQNEFQKLESTNRQKSIQSGSAFYENLIEAKDLEICRLTGIVKSLTELRR